MVSLQEPTEAVHMPAQDETITIAQMLMAALHTLTAWGLWSSLPYVKCTRGHT